MSGYVSDRIIITSVLTGDIAADAVTSAKIADDAIDSEHYTDGSIDTAHIADDQITLAKMAGGTDGNLITYDTSGDPAAVATGTSGHVLTSAGAGAAPTFVTAAGVSAAEATNIMLNAFRISVNGGLTVQNMVDGVVDEFEDETGVDTSTSTNETYDATSDFYSNPGVSTAAISHTADATNTANQTSYTFSSQSLGAADSSRKIVVGIGCTMSIGPPVVNAVTVAGISATKIINLGSGTNQENALWQADVPTGTTGDIVIGFVSGTILGIAIDVFRVVDAADDADDTGSSAADPGTTTLDIPERGVAMGMASAGGASGSYSWTGLTENTDRQIESNIYSSAHAAFASTQSGLTITADPTSGFDRYGMVIASFGPASGAPALNMTLVSNDITALAVPGDANIVIWQQDVDSVTLNTDLKAYASRNGGTTYTQMTLAEVASLTTGRILTGTVDISGQSSATAMKYKIETLNTKEQKIHAVALQWS